MWHLVVSPGANPSWNSCLLFSVTRNNSNTNVCFEMPLNVFIPQTYVKFMQRRHQCSIHFLRSNKQQFLEWRCFLQEVSWLSQPAWAKSFVIHTGDSEATDQAKLCMIWFMRSTPRTSLWNSCDLCSREPFCPLPSQGKHVFLFMRIVNKVSFLFFVVTVT